MPHINQYKESKYLKKDDLQGPVLVTIADITEDNVAMQGQPPENKPIIHFKEEIAPLVGNWTNLTLIAGATGSENTEGWIGKQIVLFVDPTVNYHGKVTGGIRVRAPRNAASPQQSRAATRQSRPPPAAAPEPESDDIPF